MATPATALPRTQAGAGGRHYQRFDLLDRVMHGLLMVTFIGCALTGLPLMVADHAWAQSFSRMLGGFQSAMLIHRICAAVMIVVFVGHVARVFLDTARSGKWLEMVWGPNSMVPNLKDVQDIAGHVRWFLGKGERPRFDRYTYWEKFDYWAVFWGMFIIGGSGLLLWFPFFFAQFLPGWVFNIAMLVHGEEALLAVGFIFTIHFFNGHVRPEKFPMDPVIFTGRISEHEMLDERGAEYDRLVAQGRLAAVEAPPPSPGLRALAYAIGIPAVLLGTVTIALIVYSFLF
ncbi:MAG: cytochrome b/b6 domain-containing protein [Burkholderiales bacterium]|nr:cytochrome b/b6 domain-containing protein [Burkholderiales bacterium]